MLRKAFANNSSTKIKLSGEILGRLLPKTGLSLLRNVLKPLDKSALISLGLTAAAAATGAAFHKKIFWFGMRTTFLISNEEINNIMKLIKSLEESGLLVKVISNVCNS